MADIQDVLNQYIDRARLLLTEGKIKDAYTLCMKVVETDPTHSGALELRKTIEDSIQNYNLHTIDEKLELLKPLWEKGEYDKLIKELTELYRYAPHYEKLEEALAQAQAMYRNIYNTQSETKVTGYQESLEQLFQQKKYKELIEMTQKNARQASQDPTVRDLHAKYRKKIISSKLAEKKSLFESEKYEEIVNYLYQLQDIDRNSEELAQLLRTYRERLLSSQIDDKREFILRASENAKNLYQLGKFEKAMVVAEEILHIDPKSGFAKNIWRSAKSKFETAIQDETEDQISSNFTTFTEEVKATPQNFIKL